MLDLFAQADAPSAGGAAIGQIVIATVMVSAILGGVAFFLLRHRAGRSTILADVADRAGKLLGLPYWAALPSVVLVASLLSAVFGVYWDVSIHIDQGRDDGPLANLAHYPILFGLIGMLCRRLARDRAAAPRRQARAPPRSASPRTGTRRSAAS